MTMTLPGGVAELTAAVMLLGANPENAIDDLKSLEPSNSPVMIVEQTSVKALASDDSALVTLSMMKTVEHDAIITGLDLSSAGHARLVSHIDGNILTTQTKPSLVNDQPILIAVHGISPSQSHFFLTIHFDGQPSVIVPVER